MLAEADDAGGQAVAPLQQWAANTSAPTNLFQDNKEQEISEETATHYVDNKATGTELVEVNHEQSVHTAADEMRRNQSGGRPLYDQQPIETKQRVFFGEPTKPIMIRNEQSPNSSVEDYSCDDASHTVSWISIEIPPGAPKGDTSPGQGGTGLFCLCKRLDEGPESLNTVEGQRRLKEIITVSLVFSAIQLAHLAIHTTVSIIADGLLFASSHVVTYTLIVSLAVAWWARTVLHRAKRIEASTLSLSLKMCVTDTFEEKVALLIGIVCACDGLLIFVATFFQAKGHISDFIRLLEGIVYIASGVAKLMAAIYYRFQWSAIQGILLRVSASLLCPAAIYALAKGIGFIVGMPTAAHVSFTIIFGILFTLMGIVVAYKSANSMRRESTWRIKPLPQSSSLEGTVEV